MEHVEVVAEERLKICRSNVCGFHDPDGSSPQAVFKGHESCAACGCRLDWKTRSLSSECGQVEVGREPLWTALTNEQDAEMIKEQIERNAV